MNSPLMDVSATATTAECDRVIEELLELFDDDTVRGEALHEVVYRAKQLARSRPSARLNLAIACGIEVVFPSHALNQQYAGSYRADARECDDFTPELELKFEEVLLRALTQRAQRSSAAIDHQLRAKYQVAVMRTQRDLDDLREAATTRLRQAPTQYHAAS